MLLHIGFSGQRKKGQVGDRPDIVYVDMMGLEQPLVKCGMLAEISEQFLQGL